MTERTGDTRTRIRDVALDLFAAQGYEQTSLREIAERLGVTKAALYYHFRSKDEIVDSVLADRLSAIGELIAWAQAHPPSPALRKQVLRRYADSQRLPAARRLAQFFERNQPALRSSPTAAQLKERMRELVLTVCGPDATPADHMRTGLAFAATHAVEFWLAQDALTDEQRLQVALTVGDELLDRT
ncbi:TetR family transcriptional regulator [Pilimelia terevasa]|uniref:TetR family transcriptional regulator n=1 Tax=Pilimelia terevasa TaxID=53372 RepID=A0A8J3FI56_9ACTN|nr:TetR/AcrR family transcriptional regulator [Pilimelia terevasa]GGK17425.1 TetR family transcriptional regulator [Pilimelia terevasa]